MPPYYVTNELLHNDLKVQTVSNTATDYYKTFSSETDVQHKAFIPSQPLNNTPTTFEAVATGLTCLISLFGRKHVCM